MAEPIKQPVEKKPDEQSGLLFQGHIKIYDPKTKEVYVNKRA